MIILPDRSMSRSRFFMAVPRREWMPPSCAQQKTFCGDEDRTRFRVRAKTHDGCVIWTGWFDDRDDADAFLFALTLGSIWYERSLWRLPVPEWPGLPEGLMYDFATYTTLTSPTGSNQTYTRPSDWNDADNTIYTYGAGGSGGWASTSNSLGGRGASGGGGGAFSSVSNLSLGATATYQIGTGGAGVSTTANTSNQGSGNAGGDTWFNSTTLAGSSAGAKGGGAGNGVAGASVSGGAGGASASGVGTVKNSGGNGGDANATTSVAPSTGGGGSAGPNGNGTNAANASTTTATAGGIGNNNTAGGGTAGSAGGATGGNGGNGTEINSSVGSGGGGGGGLGNNVNATGGSGGSYGGGGGAATIYARSTTRTTLSGAGRQGLIVVEYTPASGFSLANNNLPMLGM